MSIEFPTQRTTKMPDELRRKVELLNTFQRKYCEYRAKGLSMADASSKAGSKAKDRKGLSRVGWNLENANEGAKDYIDWLIEVRATTAMVDSVEIVDKLRRVFDDSMTESKYGEAVKAAMALGDMIGVFDKNRIANPKGVGEDLRTQKETKNDVDAFKEEGETPSERAKKVSHLISIVNKTDRLK